ncbi:glycosyltransferase [Streptomyces sp. BH106]|uniref:glycosyltransferase n=1 Tax=Streptomyces sp. BH106 TaxID=3410409 RepID=UPI003CF1A9E5
MKIAFLINNAYGIGGTIRATVNLSGAFARRHSVQVVSVERPAETPELSYDPRVDLTHLVDLRKDAPGYEGDDPLRQEPRTLFRPGKSYSLLHEQRIVDWLARTDADVVIATRPDLNGFLARDGHARYLRIGQEHLSQSSQAAELTAHQNQTIADLDAYVTANEADARHYREAVPGSDTTILCIPNGVPAPDAQPSDRRSHVVVAAGRLSPVKRYDRLIDAFAQVADRHPEWTLRLYGRGPQRDALRAQIDRLGLYDRVRLMGAVAPIETEWAKGAIAAVSSDRESFGVTIVEAMHSGVPVIATDCPHGPAEIIDHGVNGCLVPLGAGTAGYAAALEDLMTDTELRDRLGANARQTALSYVPTVMARRYEALFDQLFRSRARAAMEKPTLPSPTLRKRLRTLGGRVRPSRIPAPRSAVHEADVPPTQSGVFARAHADGSLTVRFDPFTLPPGQLDFVAQLRKDPKGRQVTVPVPDLATAPDIHAVDVTIRPEQYPLAEGRWDCYVVNRRSGRRHRLSCLLAERVAAVNRTPRVSHGALVTTLPYATTDGYLAVRAWQRPAHAEVNSVHSTALSTQVAAELLIPGPATDLTDVSVVAVSRHDESLDVVVPLSWSSSTRFSFSVPHDALHQRRRTDRDVWDLRLRCGQLAEPVPIGRIGGDIVDRRRTDRVPACVLTDGAASRSSVGPYFTATNDLALSAHDEDA